MANRYLVASGPISDPASWNGGTLPNAGDDIYANAFVGVIDTPLTANSISNGAASGIAAGGGFEFGGSYTVTASTFTGNGSNQYLFRVTNAAHSVSLVGDVVGSRFMDITAAADVSVTGNVSNGILYFNITAAASIVITGDYAPANSPNGSGVASTAAFTMVVNGNVTSGTANSNHAFSLTGAATITVNGEIGGSPSGISTGSWAVLSTNVSSSVIINGVCAGGSGGSGIYGAVSTAGTCTVNGIMRSGSLEAVGGTGLFILNGSMESLNGINAAPVRRFYWNPAGGDYQVTDPDTVTTNTLYSTAPGLNAADLREGTVVGSVTGTLAVPPKATVALGVPTDDTVGTLNLVATVDSAAAGLAAAQYITPQLLAAVTTP